MVDVQLDPNHCTKIANELLEALTRTSMGEYNWRIFLTLLLKTYGINSKYCALNPTVLAAISGIPISGVSRALTSLKNKNMIITRTAKGRKWIYIQKDYSLWNTSINVNKFVEEEHDLTVALNDEKINEDGTYRDISREALMRSIYERK